MLESGAADGVAVHYVVDANGRDNVPRPPSDPNQPSQPLDYLIAQLHVRSARVRYENVEQTPLAEEADANTLRLRLGFETGLCFSVDTVAGAVRAGGVVSRAPLGSPA